jgi:hypothetical protein
MHRPHSQKIGVVVTAAMLAIMLLYVTYIVQGKGKGKAIPVQALTGP